MADQTKIEWTDKTFNPWIGCTKVSAECANCYAETLSNFRGWAEWGKGKPRRRTSDSNWNKPRQWNREAEKSGVRFKVFCASLADVFDAEVDQEWRNQLFGLIEETPNLDWQLLTKRPENMPRMLPWDWMSAPRRNVWLGTSVGHPDTKWRIGDLVNVPAVVHFLSCEPLLADLGRVELHDIEWVICGGESGGDARPTHPAWVRSLRDQCERAGVAFFFKQWGGHCPSEYAGNGMFATLMNGETWAQSKNMVALGDGWQAVRMGKERAGKMLDGKEYAQFP